MAREQTRQAVAYLRTNDGSEEKLAAQRDSIRAWALRTGIQVAGWHLDLVSANAEKQRRPGLREAIRKLEVERAAVLVVAQPQVVARSISQMLALLRRLHEKDAEIQIAQAGFYSGQGLFFLGAELRGLA